MALGCKCILLQRRAGLRRAAGFAYWSGPPTARAQQTTDPLAALKAKFARPTFVPNPAGNPPTAAKVALGKRLFEDPELSVDRHHRLPVLP